MSGSNKHGPGRKLSLSWQQAHWLKKRDVAGVTEREGDELKGREHKKSKGSLDTYSGRVREKAERNNESPLPPTKTAMSTLTPLPSPPFLAVSLWLSLSCCHPRSVWIAFYYSTVWTGHGVMTQTTTMPPASIQTHTHIRTHNHHNSHTPRNKWGKLFVNANTHISETVARKQSYHANFSYSILTCDSPRCVHYNTCPPLVNLL